MLGRQARGRGVEEFLDADRRAVAERVAEIIRWIFLFVLLILNNFGGIHLAGAQLVVEVVIAFIYLFIGGTAPTLQDVSLHPQVGLEALGRVFLFLIVALVTGLIGDELIRERRLAVSRAAQAEALQQMSSALAYSLDVNDLFEVVLQQAVRITSAESGALILNTSGRLQLAAYHGRGGRSDKAAMAKGDALIERVIQS